MMEQRHLLEIKAGDRIWFGDLLWPHSELVVVEKITPSQIVTSGYLGRFRRMDGVRIGLSGKYITGIATPAEIEAWEKQKADEAEKSKAKEERKARIADLNNLFPNGIYVHGEWRERQLRMFSLNHLTETQVRQIADLLK
jgi:hypothetical protein